MSLLWRREEGSSLAAVLMVVLVVTVIGVSSVQLAQHSNDVSSVDRERLQSIHAAEAGVNNAIRRLGLGAGCDTSATPAANLNDRTGNVGKYRERIDPEGGTTCGQTLTRVIHAWGFAPTGNNRAMRQLEVTVKLVPQSGFPYTLFAEGDVGTILVKNSGAISGSAYAEYLDQTKNNLSSEDVVTTGSLSTLNDAVYSGTLWAAGNITLGQNAHVGKSVISSGTASGSPGNIVAGSNSVIGGDVVAKGSVTLQSGVVVNGFTSQNNPNVPAPPALQKPVFTWNPANYTSVTDGTAAQITTALNAAKNNLQGVFHSNDSSGTITIPSTATVTGPLTIVSKGKVVLPKTLSSSGGPYQVTIVALSNATDAISNGPSNFTASSGLDVLLYTLGGVDLKNAEDFRGAVYADAITLKNTFSIGFSDSLANNSPKGFTFDASSTATFIPVPTLWREIVPGAPPA